MIPAIILSSCSNAENIKSAVSTPADNTVEAAEIPLPMIPDNVVKPVQIPVDTAIPAIPAPTIATELSFNFFIKPIFLSAL